ncbi:MAG: phosphoribosylformylglycinamidine synthase subunit PurQ, partial [Angelakisella sp.]
KTIVDVSRDFLNSNGAEKHMDATVSAGTLYFPDWAGTTLAQQMAGLVSDLNICSKKGLSQRFDSTIGAGTVLMPFGGANQLTPNQAMVAKLPVLGETKTCSGMAWGYNPFIMEKSQFHGAYLAVVESLAKLVATGFDYKDSYLTFQEYFERLGSDKARWGKPVAALMGALQAQLDFGVAAIGGKDSMSGSFEQLDVPPTLVSFATAIGNTDYVVSPELKQAGTAVALLQPKMLDRLRPDPDSLKELFTRVHKLICDGKVLSAATCGCGSIAETLFKMCLGNRLGVTVNLTAQQLFAPAYGSFVLELAPGVALEQQIGTVSASYTFTAAGEALDLAQLQEQWEQTLEPVLPYRIDRSEKPLQTITDTGSFTRATPKIKVAKPHVLIPVFPGTNCEYDTARALRRAGAEPEILVINNLSPAAVVESCAALVRAIEQSQMIVLPGGFSGGDEPDGSAKFITAFFRAPAVAD